MRYFLLVLLGVSACAPVLPPLEAELPASLAGKVVVLTPADPSYGQAAVASAIKSPGLGGVSAAVVIQLTEDLPVYRMWNGPEAAGNNNRLGSWWAFDAPKGTREGYRRAYEICGTWNQLTWVAKCTLKQGAVVAIGPGQSVSAATCADSSGYETYDANRRDWQVFVNQAWNRPDALSCPPVSADYQASPADVGAAAN